MLLVLNARIKTLRQGWIRVDGVSSQVSVSPLKTGHRPWLLHRVKERPYSDRIWEKCRQERLILPVDGNIMVVTSYGRLKMYDIEDCLFIKTSKRNFLWWMPNEVTKQLSCKACCAANRCGREVGFRKRKMVWSAEGLVYLALELLLMPRGFNCKWFTNQGIFGSWGG